MQSKKSKLETMIFKHMNIAALLAVLLSAKSSVSAFGFIPSNRPSHAAARKSSLSMSSALIVQNKGGGHGEIGKKNE